MIKSIVDHRLTAVIRIMSKFSLDANIITSSIMVSKDLIAEINFAIHTEKNTIETQLNLILKGILPTQHLVKNNYSKYNNIIIINMVGECVLVLSHQLD